MKKILIFGRSCAGKSSTASLLGKKLHLPVFHHKRNLIQTEKVLSQYPEKTVLKFKNQGELDFWINSL